MKTLSLTPCILELRKWTGWHPWNISCFIKGVTPVLDDLTALIWVIHKCMSPSSGKIRPQQLECKMGSGLWRVCVYLLQEGELLGYVLCAVFILAEGKSLLTVQADVGQVIQHGAVARHRQGSCDGEGLLFRQRGRRLHYPRKPPLKSLRNRCDERGYMLWIIQTHWQYSNKVKNAV